MTALPDMQIVSLQCALLTNDFFLIAKKFCGTFFSYLSFAHHHNLFSFRVNKKICKHGICSKFFIFWFKLKRDDFFQTAETFQMKPSIRNFYSEFSVKMRLF